MNTIEIIIKSSDGYSMNWKLEATEDEQDHLAENIAALVDQVRGAYHELI